VFLRIMLIKQSYRMG